MKNAPRIKSLFGVFIACVLALGSCNDEIDFTSDDSASVENEATADSYFEETDDMSASALAAPSNSDFEGRTASGRQITITVSGDSRFTCAVITLVTAADNTLAVPKGSITIDFGTGCTDPRGNVRKGKIIITYSGYRFLANSTVTTTFDGYFINGVHIEGTRQVTNVSASLLSRPKFTITVTGGKATWPDGSFAEREGSRTREWFREANPTQDRWVVTGGANGTNRNGRVYEMTITTALVYKRECAAGDKIFMAVEGTKELIVDGKKITIDYGAGECDRMVTITVGGKSTEIEVKGDI